MINYINKTFYTPTWLFALMIATFLLRLPSFFEPYSYGDEMIYLTLGEGIRQGATLYSELHDNKPPLLYLTAAVAGSVFWFRAILAFWSLITIYIFWKLINHLFPKNKTVQIAATTTFATLTTLPLFEGNIANSEVFMIGFTIWGFYLLLKYKGLRNSFAAGLLFSIAALFKIPAAFDLPAMLVYLLIVTKWNWNNFKSLFTTFVFVSMGFMVPIIIGFTYYYLKGAFSEYLIAAYLQNVGYLSSFRPSDATEPFLVKNGPLLTRATIVFLLSIVALILHKKKRISKVFVLATVWLIFTLFAVTLPERPYPHYLVQSIPPISIFIGMLFGIATIEQVLVVYPLSLVFFVPIYFHFWKYESTPYFLRFVQYISGKIDYETYKSGFGKHVIVDEKVARFISNTTSSEDRIFVWGDNATIYAASKRLPPIRWTVDYHIHDFSNKSLVANELRQRMPVYIVIIPKSQEFRELSELVNSNYLLINTIDGVEIWKQNN